MASIGHLAIGMAAARVSGSRHTPQWQLAVAWSAVSLLPDVDVIGFAFGVNYGDSWGHRGATHSLAMAAALGLAIGLIARWFGRRFISTGVLACAVVASHALLDTMTDGGLGCALLWPFDQTRYFAPWRPIPVAPIGAAFLSAHGAMVALTEFVLFGPVFLVALGYRWLAARPAWSAFVVLAWVSSAWLIASPSEARDSLVGVVLREDTAYTPGFSENAFRAIRRGDSETHVRRHLGPPQKEIWFYGADGGFEAAVEVSGSAVRGTCAVILFDAGIVVSAVDRDTCTERGIRAGISSTEVEQRLGAPTERDWQYTWSADGGHFRMRVVAFTKGRVSMVVRRWH